MIANEASFPDGRPTPQVFDKARGYEGGAWSGGLEAGSRVLTLPSGLRLLRLHDGKSPLGPWWITIYEYQRIASSFALSHDAIVEGRSTGQSVLHYALALLSEFYGGRPEQVSKFTIIRLGADFYAYYGVGASVVTATGNRRPPANLHGREPARQIYLPDLTSYREHFETLVAGEPTDTLLPKAVKALHVRKPHAFERLPSS